jgi:STE24 endopeptidase
VNVYRRIQADPARWFSPEEVEKAKSYQRPLRRMRILKTVVSGAVLVAVLWGKAMPRLADALGVEAWPLRLIVVLAALMLLFAVVDLPFSIWQSFGHDRRWGFSTETPGTFLADQLKGFAVGLVLFSLIFLPVWWLIRTTELWWVYGWLAFFVFTVALAMLAPVLLMPLFNKFTPLTDESLADKLRARARSVGLAISDVLVMDASKRTRKDNAFFTGLGKTRRVVLFDNMLEYPHEMVDIVVAHELSHWRRRHIPRGAALGAVITFLLFGALRVVTGFEPALRWAGVDSVADPAVLPLVFGVFAGVSALTAAVQNWFSRAWERQADMDALAWTRDPQNFSEMMRRFATKNLSDVAPSDWEYLTKYSHPPVPERMAMAEAWVRGEAAS